MADSVQKNNPFFIAYGTMVERLFLGPFQPESAISITLTPTTGAGLPAESADDEHSGIAARLPADKLQRIQKSVASLRTQLHKEKQDGLARSEDLSHTRESFTDHFELFKKSVATGNEDPLAHNPFYDLTKLAFQANAMALVRFFGVFPQRIQEPFPRKIPLSRRLRDIWRGYGELTSFGSKIRETLTKWVIVGRVPLALVLFVLSSFTTAWGVNDFLQTPHPDLAFLGPLFEGSEHELARYALAFGCGFVMSSAILDFKGRLFHAMAESGRVFGGIAAAFGRNPRWLFLACFLTLLSIKTNYDGVVSIISKKGDLMQQSQAIQTQVIRALGDRQSVTPERAKSLYDLSAILQQGINKALVIILRLPEDEVKGEASSSDPRKGPRYWAKHFIVHGGYEPGVSDVALTCNDSQFAQNMDKMLQSSRIDFSPAFLTKVTRLWDRYAQHLAQTERLVRQRLSDLNGLMELKGYSPGELKRFFALEHYQINSIVLGMVQVLEENKQVYQEVTEELNRTMQARVTLLQSVDKSGTTSLSSYTIEVNVALPAIEAIDALKRGNIAIARHKSFDELQAFLIAEYGFAGASVMLMVILFLSAMIDLGDPFLYSTMTTRQGLRDRLLLGDRLGLLEKWEGDFLQRAKAFFASAVTRSVLPEITSPRHMAIQNAFYLLLEEIDPEVKSPLDQQWRQRFSIWFCDLFRITRITEVFGYNRRLEAIKRFLGGGERYFSRFIALVLPGLCLRQKLGGETLYELYRRIEMGIDENEVTFRQYVEKLVSRGPVAFGGMPFSPRMPREEILTPTFGKMMISGCRSWVFQVMPVGWPGNKSPWARPSHHGSVLGGIGRVCRILLRSTFKEPVPPFSYTRRSWLEGIGKGNLDIKEKMENLYDFVPTLKEALLVMLPRAREEKLTPLKEIIHRFPSASQRVGLDGGVLDSLGRQIEELEVLGLEILGISRLTDFTYALPALVSSADLERLLRYVHRQEGTDPNAFVGKIVALEQDLDEKLAVALQIEYEQEAVAGASLGKSAEIMETVKQLLDSVQTRAIEFHEMGLSLPNMLRQNEREMIQLAPAEVRSLMAQIDTWKNYKETLHENALGAICTVEKQAEVLLADMNRTISHLAPVGRRDRRGQQSRRKNTGLFDDPLGLEKRKDDRQERRGASASVRRSWDRLKLQLPMTFALTNGRALVGVSQDVSWNGVSLITGESLQDVLIGAEGGLQLHEDAQKQVFPSQVVRIEGNVLILKLTSQETKFGLLFSRILRDLSQ